MNLTEIPDSLVPMQYAAKICEDLGIPAKGNIQMIGEAVEAVSKNRIFRGQDHALRNAYIWLNRRVMVAVEQGQKINNLWFLNGMYNEVERIQPIAGPPKYAHHGEGYNSSDILILWKLYEAKTLSVKRRLTEAESDQLLDELDRKRGRTPTWRERA